MRLVLPAIKKLKVNFAIKWCLGSQLNEPFGGKMPNKPLMFKGTSSLICSSQMVFGIGVHFMVFGKKNSVDFAVVVYQYLQVSWP